MKKTKIICTMGPATADDEVLKEIMRSGMDVARINFSMEMERNIYQKWNR